MKTKINKKISSQIFLGLVALSLIITFGVYEEAARAQVPVKIAQVPSGQNPDEKNSVADASTVLVATVNIYDAKLIAQNENILSIEFDLSNREKVQPNIRLSLQVIDEKEGKQRLVDEFDYPQNINLSPGETQKQKIKYAAPKYLNGNFKAFAIARDQNGLMLAISTPIEVNLQGEAQYAEIKGDSCYLTVKGEPDDKKYQIDQGVDIEKEETLIIHCDALNHMQNAVNFLPRFETFWRSSAGEKVKTETPINPTLRLDPNEGKLIYYELPKAAKPQAYDVALSLSDEDGNIISNKIRAHYVLRGESATIQNLILDKKSYNKGDLAEVSLFWTPAADNFPNSRYKPTAISDLVFSVSIKDKSGNSCSESAGQETGLSSSSLHTSLRVPIIADCQTPIVAAIIKKPTGEILDKRIIDVNNLGDKVNDEVANEAQTSNSYIAIILILAAAIIAGIIVIVFRYRKSSLVLIFGIIASYLIISAGSVSADTFSYVYYLIDSGEECFDYIDPNSGEYFHECAPYSYVLYTFVASGTVNLNKYHYYPNEDILGTVYLAEAICNNGLAGLVRWSTYNTGTGHKTPDYDQYRYTYAPFSQLAPGSEGDYQIDFSGQYVDYQAMGLMPGGISVSFPYNVTSPCTPNWSCGSCTAHQIVCADINSCNSPTYTYCNQPPTIDSVTIPFPVDIGETNTYSAVATDHDTPAPDSLKYRFEWGDGTSDESDWMVSGTTVSFDHSYAASGTKTLTIKVTDNGTDWVEKIESVSVDCPLIGCATKQICSGDLFSSCNSIFCTGGATCALTGGTTWTCSNSCGSVSCSASLIPAVNGKCGNWNGCTNTSGTYCEEGTRIDFNKGQYESTWKCQGSCGGATPSCSGKGPSACGWIETNP